MLLVLLVGSTLLVSAPAAAQGFPLICLGGDVAEEGSGACGTTGRPDYPQGASVTVSLSSNLATTTYVSIRCLSGCPAGDPSASKVYWAVYRPSGGALVFPRDFTDAGLDNNGGNAVLDRAPRYNSTWSVTAHYATPVSREFNVWLYDAWSDEAHTVHPGASHIVRATGFDPGAEVSWRWERRNPVTARYEVFASGEGRANAAGATPGWFEMGFALPKSEAQGIVGCGRAVGDCYRIVLSGAGKQTEIANVLVGVANVTRSTATTPRPADTPSMQRTQNVTAEIDLYYPGGRVAYGPKFFPSDAPRNVAFGDNALRVLVEKYWQANRSSALITEIPLLFDASASLWRAQWTVPKDIEVEGEQRYRLRIPQQTDVHGNVVDEEILRNFTIEAAEMVPRIAQYWRELERTEEGVLRLDVRYHNGSAFTINDTPVGNTSPLSGCFVRLPDEAPDPAPPTPQLNSCSGRNRTWGRYYDGAWNFSVRYKRDYEDLGLHRFILDNGTTDRWGNQIFQITTQPFTVVPASPVVQLSTVMRGEETQTLERGNRVFVSATITYHDGSPYNHVVRENPNSAQARVLNGTLVRRGAGEGDAYGPIASEERFDLVESDANAGRWSGYLQLTDDDTFTPVGIWTFRFEIADNLSVPNANLSAFDREVVSSLIQFCPTFQPGGRMPTGAIQKLHFKLFYSECDVGREVPSSAIESRLSVRVYRMNPQTGGPIGGPVSNAILPTFDEATREWRLEYEIPNELFAGTYVFVIEGVDAYGNQIAFAAHSRPFTTFTDVLERAVLTQPPSEVRRGDSATAVFDAREGDTGTDPRTPPRIQLERFDTSTTSCPLGEEQRGCWVRERADVRIDDATLEDHVGAFPVGIDTPVGLYRFSLIGRDATFRVITAVSTNFTVDATQVARALMSPPPEAIVKGVPFSFHVEQMPGDKITDRVVFFDGRPVLMPTPVLSYELGRINVTWAVPYEAPTGNYTLRLSGRDVNGNDILVLTPPIEAAAASLEGRILGQPTRVLERGEDARVLFGVAYPDGRFYAAADAPRVYVRDGQRVVGEATVRREGLTFAAFWRPDADTPLGEYSFEVSPQATGGTGNLFPPLQSQTFRLVTGIVRRNPVDDAPTIVDRMQSIAFTVPLERDDKFVGFELVYYGPSLSTQVDTTVDLPEVSRTPLTHTIDAIGGKYSARFVTDQQAQTGTFRIVMTGEDAHGNAIVAQSRRFIVSPTTIAVIFDPAPPDEAFGEGKSITLGFVARYGVGQIMDESYGRPSATVLYNGRAVAQRPEIEYRDGHWFLTWTAPEILPPGDYQFAVGGYDAHGNPIATARSTFYTIGEGTVTQSFLKTVPGPSPALLLVGLAALALTLARRARK